MGIPIPMPPRRWFRIGQWVVPRGERVAHYVASLGSEPGRGVLLLRLHCRVGTETPSVLAANCEVNDKATRCGACEAE